MSRNLKAIDEAIASTQKAYYAHPMDPELAHYMFRAYQKKVELLQELAQKFTWFFVRTTGRSPLRQRYCFGDLFSISHVLPFVEGC